jgi:L-fuconolactonase
VPWPDKNDSVLYRRVLPADYRALSDPLGVTGTVVVEASAWVDDNQWILDLAAADPFIIGFVGNLKPGKPEFRKDLNRFAKNRLYRGIRIGGGDVKAALERSEVLEDLRRLSDHDLSLDVLIGPDGVADVVALAGKLPDLRIVIDHCANVPIQEGQPPGGWVDGIVACHYKPNVFMKVSGLVEGTGRTHGDAPKDVMPYRRVLDTIWGAFGEDRVIYGSNWPVSERFASLATVQRLVESYFDEKGGVAADKYFRKNATRVYKTVRR